MFLYLITNEKFEDNFTHINFENNNNVKNWMKKNKQTDTKKLKDILQKKNNNCPNFTVDWLDSSYDTFLTDYDDNHHYGITYEPNIAGFGIFKFVYICNKNEKLYSFIIVYNPVENKYFIQIHNEELSHIINKNITEIEKICSQINEIVHKFRKTLKIEKKVLLEFLNDEKYSSDSIKTNNIMLLDANKIIEPYELFYKFNEKLERDVTKKK